MVLWGFCAGAVVVVCFTVLEPALGRIGPLPQNGQDLLVPTSKRAHGSVGEGEGK